MHQEYKTIEDNSTVIVIYLTNKRAALSKAKDFILPNLNSTKHLSAYTMISLYNSVYASTST